MVTQTFLSSTLRSTLATSALAAVLAGSFAGCATLLGIDAGDIDADDIDAGDIDAGDIDGGDVLACRTDGTSPPGSGLIDEDVLVRYYINDTDQALTTLCDHAPHPDDPLDLFFAGDVAFTTDGNGNVGVRWDTAGSEPRPMGFNVGMGKLFELDNSATVTIELVVSAESFTEPLDARLLQVANSGDIDRLALRLLPNNGSERLQLYWRYDLLAASWPVTLFDAGRRVIHVVLDMNATVPARLYIDGTEITDADLFPVEEQRSNRLIIKEDFKFAVGNDTGGSSSMVGSVFYAALYKGALTSEEVLTNANTLRTSDELPQ